MKIVDANILLYAIDDRSPRHVAARAWLEEVLSATETIGFAWVVLLAVLRLSTRASVFEAPLTAAEALDLVDGWIRQPCSVVLDPTKRHTAVLRELLVESGTAGNLTSDAHLAALAIEHGAELCSCDGDFARFAGLRWCDPLTKRSGRGR